MQSNDTVRKRAPRRPPVERVCEVCGSAFTVWVSSIEQGRGRFCSTACSKIERWRVATAPYETCGTPVYAKASRRAKGGGRFCSMPCHDVFQRGAHPVEERLWLKVNKDGSIPPHRSEYGQCWLWTGKLIRNGYGSIYRHFPDSVLTHRLAWEVATGEGLTTRDVIGHICDVRNCLRNDEIGTYEVRGIALPRRGHLFKGTNADNIADMQDKGRNRSGGTHGVDSANAKLTDGNIRIIRSLYAQGGISQQRICEYFGITQSLVSKICLRKVWTHVE